MSMTIDLPEVPALPQQARFFKEGGADLVEIKFVGSKDSVIRKVKPEHMAQFREEWNCYCDGTPMKQRSGTPLTDLPGMDDQKAQQFILQNVHTAEEIAALSDAQCQALGHGTLTLRKAAHEMLALRSMKQQEKSRDDVVKASATIGSVPAEKYASESDMAEVKQGLADLAKSMADLAAALAPKKPGRPKKTVEPAAED